MVIYGVIFVVVACVIVGVIVWANGKEAKDRKYNDMYSQLNKFVEETGTPEMKELWNSTKGVTEVLQFQSLQSGYLGRLISDPGVQRIMLSGGATKEDITSLLSPNTDQGKANSIIDSLKFEGEAIANPLSSDSIKLIVLTERVNKAATLLNLQKAKIDSAGDGVVEEIIELLIQTKDKREVQK